MEKIVAPPPDKPWFAEGLRFQCTGCGKCCSGSPGYVFLSEADAYRLAEHLNLPISTFQEQYTYPVDDRISLIDLPESHDCVFLKDHKCSIYEARPSQCRTFPWWIHNLQDPTAWKEAAEHCEGINHPDAPVVPSLVIQTQCLSYLDNLLEQNFSLPR
ncbi:MAG: YkgJ family cysteine cluster protein [Chlamydiia bacterium]|nr:YkgJ family cysteine cluster protein [Chlamydiia bacterium]